MHTTDTRKGKLIIRRNDFEHQDDVTTSDIFVAVDGSDHLGRRIQVAHRPSEHAHTVTITEDFADDRDYTFGTAESAEAFVEELLDEQDIREAFERNVTKMRRERRRG